MEHPSPSYISRLIDRASEIGNQELRSFACWCARNTLAAISHPMAQRLIDAAEQFIASTITKEEMFERQNVAGAYASAVGLVGLPSATEGGLSNQKMDKIKAALREL